MTKDTKTYNHRKTHKITQKKQKKNTKTIKTQFFLFRTVLFTKKILNKTVQNRRLLRRRFPGL